MTNAAAWEAVRFISIDELVTHTKLNGSMMAFVGWTTPEGYPFMVMAAVGAPGNERVIELAKEFCTKVGEAASFTRRVDR